MLGNASKQLGETRGAIDAYANSELNLIGQTHAVSDATAATLLQFNLVRNVAGKNNDVFTRTLKILPDMAAQLGTDAPSAALKLGRALQDPVTTWASWRARASRSPQRRR